MSFAKFDVEAQTGQRPQKQSTLDKLSDSVSEFANNLTKFEKNLSAIGSSRDNSKLRSLLATYHGNLQNLSNLLEKNLQSPATTQALDDKETLIYNKVLSEFRKLNTRFLSIKNEYHEKTANFTINEELDNQLLLQEEEQSRSALANDESTPLLQQQQQQQQKPKLNERELQYHQYLIQQREQDINQLSGGVEEINGIFKDLNNLIQQQGQQVDRIEDNLITHTNNNQFANQELIKADNYQKKKSRWCFILLVILLLMFVIVLAVIS